MSVIQIFYDTTGASLDITDAVIFSTATFEQSMNAVPGTFEFTVRDPDRVLSFATGKEIGLFVDGVTMFGGYVTQVSLSSLAPAADTTDLDAYLLRTWILRGSDYNIIFDRRVLRDTGNYLSSIPIPWDTDGAMLTMIVTDYTDCDDFSTSGITSTAVPPPIENNAVYQQGSKLRDAFQGLSLSGGTIWYCDPDKTFIYAPFESVEKRWGFSDAPNHDSITDDPPEYQGATTGFRQVEAVEDASYIENDVLVWGGSAFAGASGGTVFARLEDGTSESTYGRWQYAETHFGEQPFSNQEQVDLRANVIVNGPPGADVYGQQKGLRYTQWQFTFTWYSSDVPLLDGTPDHLFAGDIVTINMSAFGVTKLLPLRSLRITFPDALADDGTHLVQFEGTFGLQLSDPFTLWRYLLTNANRVVVQTIQAATNDTTSTTYGAYYQGVPSPAPDNSTVDFTIPFPYIAGSLMVYQDVGAGLVLLPNTDFTETDPETGAFQMASAPAATDSLYAVALTLASAP